MSPSFLKEVPYQSTCHEATFEQICEYAKQQVRFHGYCGGPTPFSRATWEIVGWEWEKMGFLLKSRI